MSRFSRKSLSSSSEEKSVKIISEENENRPKSFLTHLAKKDKKNKIDFSVNSTENIKKPLGTSMKTMESWGFQTHDIDETKLNSEEVTWQTCVCPQCRKTWRSSIEDKECFSSLALSSLGDFICFECGYHGNIHIHPREFRSTWMNIWRKFLLQGTPVHVSELSEIHTYRCLSYDQGKWDIRLHVYCLVEDKIQDAYILNEDGKNWFRYKFTTSCLFGLEQQENYEKLPWVIVSYLEDYQILSKCGVKKIICLPPGLSSKIENAPIWSFMGLFEKYITPESEFILALRSTSEDRNLEEELGRRLNREKCYRVRWHIEENNSIEEQKPADVLQKTDEAYVQLLCNTANPFPVVGIYELEDVNQRFEELYTYGLKPGSSTGFPSLDEYYTVKTGQWTVVTGIPGHGKSSLLDGILVNLASIYGWRFGVFSPENQPIERHFASLMEKKIKKPFSKGPKPRITETEKNVTKAWLNDHFKIILPDEENGLWTLDAVLALARTLVYRYGIRGLVIDPWNELDHSQSSYKNETNHISESLTKIRRFARLYDVHVWIVAHPTKLEKKANGKYPVATPYDISGGAHWRNKADNALSVYRNVDEIDDDICDIYIQKIRFKEIGHVGLTSIRCDSISGAYYDDVDQDKRQKTLSTGNYIPSVQQRVQERIFQLESGAPPLEFDFNF